MDEEEKTCGQELAESANVPEQFAQLFQHVAFNLRDHAAWVGTASAIARREHDALLAVAHGYDAVASEATRTASLMRAMHDIPSAPHDPESWDQARFLDWMRQKVVLQRRLARLLLEHAEQSEQVLGQLDGSQ
ncbi:MAG TPA: hypothetical protein VFQ61_33875 [Polyangiaceae bacterium]|nr:hypothetical protein [Polyangiaceae bacterium]